MVSYHVQSSPDGSSNFKKQLHESFLSEDKKKNIVESLQKSFEPSTGVNSSLARNVETLAKTVIDNPKLNSSLVPTSTAFILLEEQKLYACIYVLTDEVSRRRLEEEYANSNVDENIGIWVDYCLPKLSPTQKAQLFMLGLMPASKIAYKPSRKTLTFHNFLEEVFGELKQSFTHLVSYASYVAKFSKKLKLDRQIGEIEWVNLFKKYGVLHEMTKKKVKVIAYNLYGTHMDEPYSVQVESLLKECKTTFSKVDKKLILVEENGTYTTENILFYSRLQLNGEEKQLVADYVQILEDKNLNIVPFFYHIHKTLEAYSVLSPYVFTTVCLQLLYNEYESKQFRQPYLRTVTNNALIHYSPAELIVFLGKLDVFIKTSGATLTRMTNNESLNNTVMEDVLNSGTLTHYSLTSQEESFIARWCNFQNTADWTAGLVKAFILATLKRFVPKEVLINWGREEFNLDESLPDGWVESMVSKMYDTPATKA